MKRRIATTIAEIVIATFSLGIVAELTIPELVETYDTSTTIMLLRQAYSALSTSYNYALDDYGTPDFWSSGGTGNNQSVDMGNILSERMRLMKNCGTGVGCFPDVNYDNLKNVENPQSLNQDPNYSKVALSNGMSFSFSSWDSNCNVDFGKTTALSNVCGFIGVDLNGSKSPNKYGVDYFGFLLTKSGVIPMGLDEQNKYPFNGFCNRNSNANNSYENGLSCSAWVLYNGNMDYLKCNNLNWNGRRSCG